MPCWTIQTFACDMVNVRLVKMTAESLGYHVKENGSVWTLDGPADIIIIDFAQKVITGQESAVSRLKMAYTRLALVEACKRSHWRLIARENGWIIRRNNTAMTAEILEDGKLAITVAGTVPKTDHISADELMAYLEKMLGGRSVKPIKDNHHHHHHTSHVHE